MLQERVQNVAQVWKSAEPRGLPKLRTELGIQGGHEFIGPKSREETSAQRDPEICRNVSLIIQPSTY